ncbi:14514_t:CDS:1, partial [Gigaspora rosea]
MTDAHPYVKKSNAKTKNTRRDNKSNRNIFNGQKNVVITNFGMMSTYNIEDGVDQGETIALLLWRIYYNPLLSEV